MITTSISKATRAAIEGGLDHKSWHALADQFQLALENCTSLNALFTVEKEAMTTFATRVREVREKRQPRHILRCKEFVRSNLNRKFTLQEIADELYLSPSYLFRLFREQEGMTITEYTKQQRIEAAKGMLRYSGLSLSTISQYLCFQRQSHFSRVFREQTGQTPSEFRNHYVRA